jgi:hypothetical protein
MIASQMTRPTSDRF